jgi:hypothetical protein
MTGRREKAFRLSRDWIPVQAAVALFWQPP